jgi:oligoribonuclease NrnB/cAMP/cGMP phosphodiesterase (DHH superfamily)
MKTYCVYHRDQDGFFSAYVFWLYAKTNLVGQKISYLSINYDDAIPNFRPKSKIWVFDFCFPRDTLLSLKKAGHDIFVIDHHKTHFEATKGLDFVKFDMEKSGCMLTLEYFFPNEKPPYIIKLVEDRDLWRFQYGEDTEKIHALLSSYPLKFNIVDDIKKQLETNPEELLKVGEHLVRYQQQIVNRIAQNIRMKKMFNIVIPVSNTPIFVSEVSDLLLKKYTTPFVASYFDKKNFRIWSIRSRGDVDCSELAKKFGGGGHPAAGGWQENLDAPSIYRFFQKALHILRLGVKFFSNRG